MNAASHPPRQSVAAMAWRSHPGYLSQAGSNFESVHVLMGQFLADRHSANPLPDKSLLTENTTFEWGKGKPLEKVIHSQAELEHLMLHPALFRNAISILEPWEHVGQNPLGEDVRASLNVAYITQKIADCDAVLFPLWSSGILDPDVVVPLIASGLAVVVEGGNASVRDASNFADANCSLDDLHRLVEALLLSRSPISALALFICLGHQLAAQGHINLIKRAVEQVCSLEASSRDPDGKMLEALKRVCQRIKSMGQALQITKKGQVVAAGWNHPEFVVASNEHKEVGDCQLHHYQSPDSDESGIPPEVISAHEVTAHEYKGVIDTTIEYEHELNISMFHSEEVNHEAILFANWAYRLLRDAIIPHRSMVASSPLAWLLQLPNAVEILCSTAVGNEIITECSATCIIYRDFESKLIRRSFTCQFHPELFSDLRVVGARKPPSYEEMKQDDGTRLFARLLYEGMQE